MLAVSKEFKRIRRATSSARWNGYVVDHTGTFTSSDGTSYAQVVDKDERDFRTNAGTGVCSRASNPPRAVDSVPAAGYTATPWPSDRPNSSSS